MKKLNQYPIYLKITSFLLIIAILNVSVGCHYYKAATAEKISDGLGQIDSDRYVIVHFQLESWGMNKLIFDQENDVLSGYKTGLTRDHLGHDSPRPSGNRFKPRIESPNNEIHVYITEYETLGDGSIVIPVDSIKRVDVYDYQVGATIASYVFTTLGILAGLYLIILIIVLLTKSSCPFVYIYDGKDYHFQGEMFGGAVSKNMQRDDYMPLPGFKEHDRQFRLKITNELKERQYTDIAELIYFEHAKGVQILFDQKGDLHTIRQYNLPSLAITDKGVDLSKLVSGKDSLTYDFQGESAQDPALGAIALNFNRPRKATSAKLLLTLKNSLWMDYIYGKFIEQFGEKYEEFAEKQKNVPADRKRQWMIDQSMLLAVKVKTKKGWKTVDHLNFVGPLAARDIVVPLELDDVDSEILQVRLESGFHFWEIDYAAVDFTEDLQVSGTMIKVKEAKDENGVDIVQALLYSDGNFLAQLYVGNEAYLTYEAPKLKDENNDYTVLLHTKGYYEYIREFTGKPNVEELKKFRKKGAFPQFAKNKFIEISPAL